MLPADYVTTVAIECRTCDLVGLKNNAGSLMVGKLVRDHVMHDATFTFSDTRRKGKK